MQIAMYRILSGNVDLICEVTESREDNEGCIRLSNPIDVEFEPINDKYVQEKQASYLMKDRINLEQQLARINMQIQSYSGEGKDK